eukprot:1239889-Rhodomonas_salina.1
MAVPVSGSRGRGREREAERHLVRPQPADKTRHASIQLRPPTQRRGQSTGERSGNEQRAWTGESVTVLKGVPRCQYVTGFFSKFCTATLTERIGHVFCCPKRAAIIIQYASESCHGEPNRNAGDECLPGPSFTTHRPFLTGTRQNYKTFLVGLGIRIPEAVAAAAA